MKIFIFSALYKHMHLFSRSYLNKKYTVDIDAY